MSRRLTNLDWLPIDLAQRDLIPGSAQVVLLYKPAYDDQCYLEYTTSNPDYALQNAKSAGYTEFAILVE